MALQAINTNNRIKFRIMGEVQGVGMRDWISAEAEQRNLAGWVRNEDDTSVAALFIGADTSLGNISNWLAQGAPAASVIDICELVLDESDVKWDPSTGFSIISCH